MMRSPGSARGPGRGHVPVPRPAARELPGPARPAQAGRREPLSASAGRRPRRAPRSAADRSSGSRGCGRALLRPSRTSAAENSGVSEEVGRCPGGQGPAWSGQCVSLVSRALQWQPLVANSKSVCFEMGPCAVSFFLLSEYTLVMDQFEHILGVGMCSCSVPFHARLPILRVFLCCSLSSVL